MENENIKIVYVGQYPDGTYMGVTHRYPIVKTKRSALRLITPDYFIKKGLNAIPIRIRKRKCEH